jgi:hypothetical protein
MRGCRECWEELKHAIRRGVEKHGENQRVGIERLTLYRTGRACDDLLPQHKQIEIGTMTHVRMLDVNGHSLSYQRYRAIKRPFTGSAN